MRKAVAMLSIAVLFLTLIGSLGSTLSDRLAPTRVEAPNENTRHTANAGELQTADGKGDNIGCSVADSSQTELSPSSEYPHFQLGHFTQNGDVNEAANPPDGAIYYGGEAPYAYLPTSTPKEFNGLPIVPLEPES